MTIYAVADKVPDSCLGITPKKLYPADDEGAVFWIIDDAGYRKLCCWNECPKLNGGDWKRVEI